MTREVAQGNSLAGGEELVTGSKVPSDLLQLEVRTFRELGLHAFILRIPLHVYDAQLDQLARVRALLLYHTTEINQVMEENKHQNNCKAAE